MIVVAIIGILAAVAIPQYQNYIAKSQMTRVVGELSALKSAAEVAVTEGKEVVLLESDVTDFAAEASLGYTKSNLLEKVEVKDGDEETVSWVGTVGGNAAAAVKGATVTIARTNSGSYTCTIDGSSAGSGWNDSYIPTGCSNT